MVARALLDDLLQGIDFVHNKAESLTSLAMRMENCSIAFEQMNYSADLNAMATIERLSRILPEYLQHQWAEAVDRLTLDSREPNFRDLTDFIASKARVARSRFGQMANESRQKLPVGPLGCDKARQELSCAIHNGYERDVLVKSRCIACTEDHSLEGCPKFIAMTVANR